MLRLGPLLEQARLSAWTTEGWRSTFVLPESVAQRPETTPHRAILGGQLPGAGSKVHIHQCISGYGTPETHAVACHGMIVDVALNRFAVVL